MAGLSSCQGGVAVQAWCEAGSGDLPLDTETDIGSELGDWLGQTSESSPHQAPALHAASLSIRPKPPGLDPVQEASSEGYKSSAPLGRVRPSARAHPCSNKTMATSPSLSVERSLGPLSPNMRLFLQVWEMHCAVPRLSAANVQASSKEEGTESTAPGAGFWQTHTSYSSTSSKQDASTAPGNGVVSLPIALPDRRITA